MILGVVSASVSVSSKSTTRRSTQGRGGLPGTALKKRTSSRIARLYSARIRPATHARRCVTALMDTELELVYG